ncbi:MAG: HAD-IB family phosphatase [Lachnospiraceae bacterium]|nr:HAD-IB family phosphatase [Lachnospiraceae bacterium]
MNVYDFDKTIYRRDSSTDFVLYLFRRRPALLRYVPSQLAAAFRHYVLHRITKTQMKERFFSLFAACPEGAAPYVTDFWAGHRKHLLAWYRRQQRADDLIISASPRFLLEPVCRELGVTRLIASEVDPKNGRFTGLNCHGQEKLRRFREQYPLAEADAFYSDSLSDSPLAGEAACAYLIKKGEKCRPWPGTEEK